MPAEAPKTAPVVSAPTGAGTQPVQAPTVTPEPAKAPPGGLRVRFNHADMDLSAADAAKFAQIGLKASKLDEERRAFEAQKAAEAAYSNAGRLLEQTLQRDPRAYEVIKAALAGQYTPPPGAREEVEDDGLTAVPTSRSVPTEVEQRMLRIESAVHQITQSLHQGDSKTRLDAALNRPFLRANREAAELARTLVPAIMQQDGVDYDAAAVVAEGQVKRLIEEHLAGEIAAREARRETTPVPSHNGGAPFPRMDPTKATYGDLKSGAMRKALNELYAKARASVSGPPT